MSDNRVAVVIPCHNYGRYLGLAVESALAQTHPVTVTVIDDGSTDNSLDVARSFEPDIQVVAQTNIGVQRTMNAAIASLDTDYFVRLDADDRLWPSYVEAMLKAVERTGADFAYCDMAYIGMMEGFFLSRPFSAWSLMRRPYINASALTSCQAFRAAGGYRELGPDDFDTGHDDWDLWLRMVTAGFRGTYVHEPLLIYRRHPEGSRNRELADEWPKIVATIRHDNPRLYRKIRFRLSERKPFVSWLDRYTASAKPQTLALLDRVLIH